MWRACFPLKNYSHLKAHCSFSSGVPVLVTSIANKNSLKSTKPFLSMSKVLKTWSQNSFTFPPGKHFVYIFLNELAVNFPSGQSILHQLMVICVIKCHDIWKSLPNKKQTQVCSLFLEDNIALLFIIHQMTSHCSWIPCTTLGWCPRCTWCAWLASPCRTWTGHLTCCSCPPCPWVNVCHFVSETIPRCHMAHVISRTEAGYHTSGDTEDGVTSGRWRNQPIGKL